ncbi:hypothetical protein Avbf_08872 [Armadillidium vulgare]|nr:hypothetical protein Avbf_08872 [Armadillidium vulgare]
MMTMIVRENKVLVIATLVAVAYSLPTSLESNKDHSSEASSLEAKKLENFESQSFEKVSIEVNSEEITEDNAFSPNIKESSPDHKSPTHPTLLSSNIQSESDEISKERNSLETENSDEEGFLPKSFIDGVNAIRELLERLEKLATAFISKKSRDHTEDEKIDNIPLDSKESVEVGSFDKYAKEFEGLKEQDLSQEIISKELDSTEDSKEKILSKEIISKELDLTLESKEQALSTETISKELSSTEESKEEVLSKETISKELNSTEEKSKPSLPNPPSGEKRKVFRSFQVSTDFDSAGKDNNSNQRDKDFSDEESSEKSELVELLNDKENPSSHSIEVFVDAESENSQETSTNKSPELHIFQSSSEEKVEIITSSKIIKKLFGIIDDTNLVLKEDERLGNKYLLDYSVENFSNEDSVEKISVEKISADDSFEKIDFTDISKENDSEDLSVEKNNLSNIYIASNEEFILQSSDLNNPSVQLELEFQIEEDSKEQDEQINVSISKELISQETLNSKEVTDKITKSSESFELELQTEDNSKEQDEQINISISKELISQETLISKEVSDKTTKSSESFELLLKDIMNKVKQNKTSTTDSFENISGFHNEDVSLEAEKEIEFVAIIPFKSEFEPIIGVQAASESVKFNQGDLHSVGKLPHSIRGPGITLSEANRAVESLLTVSQRRKLSQKPLLLETPQTSENNRHFGVPLEESNKATEQNLLKSSSNFLAQYNIVDTSGLPLNANILKPVGSADGEQSKLNNLQTEIVTENLATTKLISNNPVQWGIPLEKANTEVRLQVSKIPYYIRGYGKSLSEANKALKESGIENRNNIQQSDVNSNVAPSSDLQVKEVHSQPSSLAKSANSLKTQGPSSEKLSQSGISLDAANAAVDNQFKSLVFRAQTQSKHSQYQVRGFGKTLEEANTAFRASHDTSSKSNILPNLSEDPRRNFKVLSKSETSSIAINSDNSSEFLEVESSPEVADSNASSNIKIPVLSQNNGVPLSSANKAVEEKFESLVKIAQHIPKNSQFHVKGFGKPLIEVNTALEKHGVPLATITPQEEIETKITSALGHIPISSINDGLSLSSANAATAENFEKFAKIIDEQPKNSPNHVKGFGKSLDSANRGQETSTQAKNKSFSNILDSSNDSEHGVQLVAVSPQEEIETGIHSSSTHHNNIPSNIGLPLNTAILAEENFESPKEDPQTNVHGKSLVDLNAALANSAIEVESADSSTLLEQGVQLGTVSPQEIETGTSISTFVGLPLNSEIITEGNFENPLQDSQNKAPKSQKPQILTDGVQLTSTGVGDNDLTNNADSSVISTHGVQLVTITPQEEMEITVTNAEANIPLSSATITEENFKSIINFPQNQPQDSQLSANIPGKSLEDLNTALENLSSGVENTKLSHSSNSSVILTHGVQLAPAAPIQEIESETSTSTPHNHIDPSNSGLPLKFVVVIPEVFENLGKVANNHNQTSQFQSDGFGEPLKDVNSTADNFAIETTSQDLDSSFTSQHGVPLTTVIDQNGNESEVISSTTINPISSALGGLPLKSTNLLKDHLNSFVNNNNQNPSQNSEPPLNESGKSLDDANRSVENSAIKESLKDSLLKADSLKVSNTGDELSIFLSENNDTTQNPISKDIFESEIPLEATTSGFGLNLEELALTLNKNEVNSLKTFNELFSTTVSPEFIEREVSLEPANIAGSPVVVEGLVNGGISLDAKSSHEDISSINTNKKTLSGNKNPITVSSSTGVELPTIGTQNKKQVENLDDIITESPSLVEGFAGSDTLLDAINSLDIKSSIGVSKIVDNDALTKSKLSGVSLTEANTAVHQNFESLKIGAQNIQKKIPFHIKGFGKFLDEANNEFLRTQEKSQSNLPSTEPNVSQLFSNGFELEEISSIAESPENEASASHIKHTITSIKFPETGVPLDRKSTDKVHIGKVRIHSESEKHKLNKQIKGRGKSIESANRASQTLHKPGRKVLVNKKIKLRPATKRLE